MNRQFLLAARPVGMVKRSDFKLVETPISANEEDSCLVKVQYMGLEPAMRGWMENRADYIAPLQLGDVMRGFGAGEVIESKSANFPVGTRVTGSFGWQEYFLHQSGTDPLETIPDGVSLDEALGVFGVTGMTAWFGLNEIGRPKPGDVLVVSSAGGATGSIAGQLALAAGCRVVGITSTEEKCQWLRDSLGFDAVINYTDDGWPQKLQCACPDGIDIYFDNAGGAILDTALGQIRDGARVVLCGGISRYNLSTPPTGPGNYFNLIFRRAKMEGFIVLDHAKEFNSAISSMRPLLDSGQLKNKTTITDGFEALPDALISIFQGSNIGKQLVRISAPCA